MGKIYISKLTKEEYKLRGSDVTVNFNKSPSSFEAGDIIVYPTNNSLFKKGNSLLGEPFWVSIKGRVIPNTKLGRKLNPDHEICGEENQWLLIKN